MNLFKKIGVAVVGIAMAIGVGVAVGSNNHEKVVASAGDQAVSTSFSTTAEYFLQATSSGTTYYLTGTTGDAVGTNASWGVVSSSNANALRFTLSGSTVDSGTTTITANAPYSTHDHCYISPLTSKNFKLQTTTVNLTLDADGVITNPSNSSWKLRLNGSSGFRWYNSDTGVVAQLVEAPSATKYTVTYNGNDADSGSVTDAKSPYNSGSTVTTLANDFIRSGYTFNGWNTADDGSGTPYAPGATFTISSNTVLYAQWLTNYTVTYVHGEGASGDDYVVNDVPEGNYTLIAVNATEFSHATKQFKCWSVGGVEKNPGETISVSSNTTVTAVWATVVTLSYNGNGAASGSTSSSNYGVGATATVASNGFVAATGKAFKEWNTSADGSGTPYAPGATFTIEANVELFAIWIDAYFVNFGTDATTDRINGSTTDFDDVYTIPSGITVSYSSGDIFGAANKCLRLGAGSTTGIFSVTLGSDYYITKVSVSAKYYGTDSTATFAVTPNGGSASSKALTSNWSTLEYDISSSQVSSCTVGTNLSGKRAYVSSITVAYAAFPASLTLTSVSGNSFTEGDSGDVTATITVAHCTPDHYGKTSSDSTVLNSSNISIVGTTLTIARSNVSAGTTTVTVTAYDDGDHALASDSFTITCAAAVRNLLSIAKTTNSSDTLFEQGDKFTIANLVITGTFDAAPLTEDVTSGCTFKLWNGSSETALIPGTTTLSTAGDFTVRITHSDSAAAETLTYTIKVIELVKATIDYTSLDDFAASYKNYDGGVATTYGNSLSSEIDLRAIQFYKGSQSSVDVLQTNASKTDPALYNTSAVPGSIRRITITAVTNDNATPTIYFATDAPATTGNTSRVSGGKVSLSAKVGSISVSLASGYRYFFLDCNTCGGATYMSKIEVEYAITDSGAAKNYEDHFLMMQAISTSNEDDTNACRSDGEGAKSYYSNAKTAYGKLTTEIKNELSSDALARLHAWAEANTDNFDVDSRAFVSRTDTALGEIGLAGNSATLIIVVISLLSVTALGGYFLLRRRKEN